MTENHTLDTLNTVLLPEWRTGRPLPAAQESPVPRPWSPREEGRLSGKLGSGLGPTGTREEIPDDEADQLRVLAEAAGAVGAPVRTVGTVDP